MAIQIDTVPKPVVTRRRDSVIPTYTDDDARSVMDALMAADEGFVVAFDGFVAKPSQARQRAAQMVDIIERLSGSKLSTRVVVQTEQTFEKDGKTVKTPGEYRAAIINRPAKQRKPKTD